eukprot:CAMPEP_0172485292 /NCGR_PEP_ID=MMETSP1066-20121228/13279_1 /TAXON_ID=671091 /ORGANISM="Coscinodiscus wailesii, Strain CCMP2513" /LENGTH=127 /DNA_ID=CAMNT_0013250467 /DNA_START=66 /DNA_END=449 /DNA_ORIENTATION=+
MSSNENPNFPSNPPNMSSYEPPSNKVAQRNAAYPPTTPYQQMGHQVTYNHGYHQWVHPQGIVHSQGTPIQPHCLNYDDTPNSMPTLAPINPNNRPLQAPQFPPLAHQINASPVPPRTNTVPYASFFA